MKSRNHPWKLIGATNLFNVFYGIMYVWPVEACPENLGAAEAERGSDVALDLRHVYNNMTSSAAYQLWHHASSNHVLVEYAHPHSPCRITVYKSIFIVYKNQ